MKLMYLFDDKIKAHFMKGKKYCNPQNTGILRDGISCIRQNDVNLWFYTKGDTTIAIDAGHLDFPGMRESFHEIGIVPEEIRHLFITHSDVDHCGGIEKEGTNIFPNAQVYLGSEEVAYLDRTIYRISKFGLRIKNCVTISEGYRKLEDREIISIGDIKVEALHIPGHTLGHMCYVVDDMILFSGDCLAINDEGGYSFFDLFTQYPEMNKKSLIKLKNIIQHSHVEYICTGHSGIKMDIEKAFMYIDQSAAGSRRHPFDINAP